MKFAPVILLAIAGLAFAEDRIAWSVDAQPASAAPGGTVLVHATARVQPGWHLYSASSPAGRPLSFRVEPGEVLRTFQQPPKRGFDSVLNEESETYEREAVFYAETLLPEGIQPGPTSLKVGIAYQTCDDRECIPARWLGPVAVSVDPAAAAKAAIPAGFVEAIKPVPGARPAPAPTAPADQGWTMFLLVAFGFGVASIFTPCVFPMIPITMSYFLNRQSGTRRDAVFQAVVFCLGIIVLFSGLGLAATAILGSSGMAQLGSNPWVNAFIAALFIAFSFSLLGAFEITVPSSVLTRLNKSSEGGGVAGTLLMGLTFSLASFSCVGPFVGTLLAASVTGGAARPAVGMVAFASGLALPFFMLALFPSYLKRLPKSGGWMARIKVVMGFIILAASLKYLSSVDQVMQWGFLTRERFLAVWVVLFSLAGLYLLGFVRLEGVKPDERLGLVRLLCGVALVAFGISLLPGMFGGRLGELEGFVPEPSAASLSARGGEGGGLVWMKNDYRGALERAKSEGKPLFIAFTGYACTNCHWMKANMFTRPEIAAALKNFVLLELYTDGTDAPSEANAQLQLARFQSSAIPLYAILGPNERVIASSAGLTRDVKAYLAFLSKGQGGAVPSAPAQVASAGIPPLKTLSGGKLDTAPLAGKVVVLNFWATWCVPCAEEIPSFNKVYKELSPQGVALIGASADDDGPEVIQSFLKKHPIDYTVARVTDEATQAFELDALPMTVIFNREGREVKRFNGVITEAILRAAVQNAL